MDHDWTPHEWGSWSDRQTQAVINGGCVHPSSYHYAHVISRTAVSARAMLMMSHTKTPYAWGSWSDHQQEHDEIGSERAHSPQSRYTHDTTDGTAERVPTLMPFHQVSKHPQYSKVHKESGAVIGHDVDWDAALDVAGHPQYSSGSARSRPWAQYEMLLNRTFHDLEPVHSSSSATVCVHGDECVRDSVYDSPTNHSAGKNQPRKSAYASVCAVSSEPRDSHGTGFRLRSKNAQRNRAPKRAGQFWDKRAAHLAPMAAKYSPYGRMSGWLAVLVSPPVEEEYLREALERFMTHLWRATKQAWPLAAWAPFKDKEGAHLGKQY